MSEHYFVLNLTTERGDESFTCTGDNAELYRHKPQYREVDHVFVRISDTDRRLGGFVWRHILGEEEFERVSQFMYQSGEYPIHYRPEPTESDFEQFLHDQSQDLEEGLND